MAMLASIEEALAEIRKGNHVIVVDDEDRENEGDLILAAEKATPAAVNFMMVEGRGIICVAMTGAALERLDLEPQTQGNTSRHGTAYMISVDAAPTSTGVSAHDRALTIRTLADPKARPEDLLRPGHIMPLKASEGGVLRRAGHTEAAVDLAGMAGLTAVGVTCEIVNLDGTMARMPQLESFAEKQGIKMITIADLIRYRLAREKLVERITSVDFPTRFGDFRLYLYRNLLENTHHLALTKGAIDPSVPVLVRVHSECLTGDLFHCLRCDCGEQLEGALSRIEREGKGVLVYMLNHEGRGIGLANKVKAYSLQEKGLDTVEANRELGFPDDLRDYGQGAQILADLGVRRMRFMTNNPRKVVGLEAYGLSIEELIPIQVKANPRNAEYLRAKREKLGHLLEDIS
jgi:3,4-dihydroxy 2-butanone 4-phosphate synthase/GTP cyclohydrolase II